jgi:hypothetical protein
VRYSDSCFFTLATLYCENLTARQAMQTQAPVTSDNRQGPVVNYEYM